MLDVLQIIEASRQNKNDSAMVAGLPCYVALSWCHNHDIATAEALSYHSPAADLKETFMAYFNEGMNPAAAMKFNKDCLEMAVDFTEQHLADGSKNPLPRSVYWWHDQWRMENLGKYIHIYIYMLHVH